MQASLVPKLYSTAFLCTRLVPSYTCFYIIHLCLHRAKMERDIKHFMCMQGLRIRLYNWGERSEPRIGEVNANSVCMFICHQPTGRIAHAQKLAKHMLCLLVALAPQMLCILLVILKRCNMLEGKFTWLKFLARSSCPFGSKVLKLRCTGNMFPSSRRSWLYCCPFSERWRGAASSSELYQ